MTQLDLPTISTEVPQSVYGTTAILTANLLKNGGYDVTNCGFVYGTNQDNLENEILKGYMGAEKGIFTLSVDNLIPSTKYYYCAFAKNSEGTGFGDVKSFVTGPGKFSITNPLNGNELSEDNNIDLIWTKSDSATGYYVSLNKTSEVDSKLIDRYNCGNSQSYQISSSLLTEGEYRVAVGAYNSAGAEFWQECAFSIISSTTPTPTITPNPISDSPIILYPAEEATISADYGIDVTWTAASGAAGYSIELTNPYEG